jgi:2-amino-4-hydroxy-6-hydroxymethyldihydropteridine diphosphokinase
VVTVDEVRSVEPELLLPHPGTADRATVLIPWLEIDPAAYVLDLGSAAELLARLPEPDRAGVHLRPDLAL